MNMAWSDSEKLTSSDTWATGRPPSMCDSETQRQCVDGSCIPRMELCPEEELLNQDTILIMIGVGMGVVVFLIILYCLQQRRNAATDTQDTMEETDHPELLMPPPSYREAVNVCLYPPTPEQVYRNRRMPSMEEPITPPPNYDAALSILAQSHESVLVSKDGGAGPSPSPSSPTTTSPHPSSTSSSVLRRSLSVEHVASLRGRPMTFSSFGANNRTFNNDGCITAGQQGT